MEFLANLQALRNTLNCVSVSGADNLDRVLGCIQKLDEMIITIKEKRTNEGDRDHFE